jgi:hypothetical protein
VCLWREHGDAAWQHGAITFPSDGDDGAGRLFGLLTDGTPEAFQDWARDYHEMPIDLEAVRHIYAGRPLVTGVLKRIHAFDRVR